MREITDQAALQSAVGDAPTAVLFHATWCPFCRKFRPEFERRLGSAKAPVAVEALMDDEENPLWDLYGIAAVPTVLFFDHGVVVRRLDAKPGIGLEAGDLEQALPAR